VRDRIVAETRGNPLALLELTRGRALAELAGGFGLPDVAALSRWIEQSFRDRLAALPPPTRLLVLIAAAEPVGDPVDYLDAVCDDEISEYRFSAGQRGSSCPWLARRRSGRT
jgi:hypothetical protein